MGRPPPSLRQQLLRWLVPASALLVLGSATLGYFVALSSATLAYDRALLDGALALSKEIRLNGGRLALDLQPQALQVLTTDKYDRIFFTVRGPNGEWIGGNERLSIEESEAPRDGGTDDWSYRDHVLKGEPIRMAVLHTSHAQQPLTILVAETTEKRKRLVREVLIAILLPGLLLVIATLVIVTLSVRRGLQPLDELRGQLARRSHTDLRPIRVGALPDEIQPLAHEINNLLTKLDASLDAQRHFVADAAHQLRTPIAALQAQVEALQQEGGGAQSKQLAPVLAGVRRMAHLVRQLLALARAEPRGTQDMAEVAIDRLIQSCADRWLPDAIARGIDLGFELTPIRIIANPLLLEEMLGNLVDNALRYTPNGGSVTVRCGQGDGTVWVEVEDSGPGIVAGNRARVFERFVRLEEGDGEGCGVGLAIVQRVAMLHGGKAEILDAPAGGTRIRVSLRQAAA